jgi:hypothetical protein
MAIQIQLTFAAGQACASVESCFPSRLENNQALPIRVTKISESSIRRDMRQLLRQWSDEMFAVCPFPRSSPPGHG